jgi:hypothetical protein
MIVLTLQPFSRMASTLKKEDKAMARKAKIKNAKNYDDIKPKGKIFMRPQYNAALRTLRTLEFKIIDMAACYKAEKEREGE